LPGLQVGCTFCVFSDGKVHLNTFGRKSKGRREKPSRRVEEKKLFKHNWTIISIFRLLDF